MKTYLFPRNLSVGRVSEQSALNHSLSTPLPSCEKQYGTLKITLI